MCNLKFQKLLLEKLCDVECGFYTRVVTNGFETCVEKIIMEEGFGDNTLYDGIERNKFDFTKLQVVEKIRDCIAKQGCDVNICEVAEWFKMAYDVALEEF